MRLPLQIHPDSRSAAVTGIEVEAARSRTGLLALRYRVAGSLSGLVVPSRGDPERTDELWRHTCFEAFIRPAGGQAYWEINLSPSTAWAAYRFDAYREGMDYADGILPRMEVHAGGEDGLDLMALLELDVAPHERWLVGLSAVIEEEAGHSYWALAHPPGKADFHHPDCFALELHAPVRP
jgi:hypothetical protein